MSDQVTPDQFFAVDIRVGRVLTATFTLSGTSTVTNSIARLEDQVEPPGLGVEPPSRGNVIQERRH